MATEEAEGNVIRRLLDWFYPLRRLGRGWTNAHMRAVLQQAPKLPGPRRTQG